MCVADTSAAAQRRDEAITISLNNQGKKLQVIETQLGLLIKTLVVEEEDIISWPLTSLGEVDHLSEEIKNPRNALILVHIIIYFLSYLHY